MYYAAMLCVVGGLRVIWHGITHTQHDPDSPRLVRELCPVWWYRLCAIAFGLLLVLIGFFGTYRW
jgi:hypothetical protein